jgi:SAM-dependent methyltransferase
LNQIQKVYSNTTLTNVEIIDDYKRFLVSQKIRFVLGSILDSNFPNEAFDVIIIRDVLHHLVGEGYKETLNNQRLSLMQLKRLVKPGGVIFIEELTNESEIASRIIYYLSWLNTKIGIHIPSLFISKNVIVAFLTSNKLLNLCNQVFGKKNIEKKELDVKVKWHLTFLHFLGGL